MLVLVSTAMPTAFAPTTVQAPTVNVAMSAEKFKVFADSNVADTTLEKPWTSGEISDEAGLRALAKKLNPVVGYWGAPRAAFRGDEAAWLAAARDSRHAALPVAGQPGACAS